VQDERNIDPSILEKESRSSRKANWWTPVGYRHPEYQIVADEDWIQTIDFPMDIKMLIPTDEWMVLYCNFNWEKRNSKSKEGYPIRDMWMHLRSYVVKNSDMEKIWKWIQKKI